MRQPFFERSAHAVEQPAGVFGNVPLVDRDDQRAAFFEHQRGDLEILVFQSASRIEQQHDNFGKIDCVARIGYSQLFQLFDHQRLFAHTCSVDQPYRPRATGGIVPGPVDRDRIAGNPGFWPGQQAVFAQDTVDQRRFARIRPTDDGQFQNALRIVFGFIGVARRGRFGFIDQRQQSLKQVAEPFAMFGRQRDRFPKTQRKGLIETIIARAAFGLVGDEDHRNRRFMQMATDFLVEQSQPGARIDHEQRDRRAGQRRLGLNTHPARQRGGVFVFPTGGVDNRKRQTQQVSLSESAVASNPGLVIDQRQPLAHQPVEQRGFAHIGTADDDNLGQLGGGHAFCRGGLGTEKQAIASIRGMEAFAYPVLTVSRRRALTSPVAHKRTCRDGPYLTPAGRPRSTGDGG